MRFVDVIVPGPWWNALTYISDEKICAGARVRVPIRLGVRVGFAVGENKNPPPVESKNIKKIIEVLDTSCVLGNELWALSRQLGSSFLCGRGEVLKVMSPTPLLKCERVAQIQQIKTKSQDFSESHCYNPIDSKRYDFYISKLDKNHDNRGTALVLFPERASAENFFALMPSELKENSLLWTGGAKGKSLWQNWLAARSGTVKIVIGSIAACYAPLPNLSLVIVEDEANPAYIPVRNPKIHVRSAAGQRALISRAALVLGGRMPSAKTYMREKIPCTEKPNREHLHFVDIRKGFEAAVQGVEGTLPLSKVLVTETQKCVSAGNNALWIFDRKGYAVDIVCDTCGWGPKCEKCGAILATDNELLKCFRCGTTCEMPQNCRACGGELFVGKRPGVEALEEIAKSFGGRGEIFVGTRKILALCDKKNISLVGWIDIDAEMRKPDYKARSSAFSMVWESYWRGTSEKNWHQVIVQGRNTTWYENLKFGWAKFWDSELAERGELGFPPCEIIAEIKADEKEVEELAKMLESDEHIVMQPGDGTLWASGSLAALEKTLSPRFSINKSRLGFPKITIFVE